MNNKHTMASLTLNTTDLHTIKFKEPRLFSFTWKLCI